MACLKKRIFSSVSSGIRSCSNACRKLFGKRSSKNLVSNSSSAVWYVELGPMEQDPILTSVEGADDNNIQLTIQEVAISHNYRSLELPIETAEMEILPLSASDDQASVTYQHDIPAEEVCHDISIEALIEFAAAQNEDLPFQAPDEDEVCPDISIEALIEFATAQNEDLPFQAPDDEENSNFLLDVTPEAEQSDIPVIGDCLDSSSPWIVDVSWEACNPTSVIYYDIQAKASYHASTSQYTIIGPYNPVSSPNEFEEMDLPPNHPLTTTVSIMRNAGYKVLVGKWLIRGSPITILFGVDEAEFVLNECLAMIDNNFPDTINVDDYLATDGIVFGFMAAIFLNIFNIVLKKQAMAEETLPVNIIAHFHEWTSASGIMMMKVGSLAKGVATSYTTHETPQDSYTRTDCIEDWIGHRELLDNFARDAADLYIECIPECEDELDSLYEAAVMSCANTQRTLYFDVTSMVNYHTFMAIRDFANNEENVGRYFVHAPIFDESNLNNIIDEVELPESPLSIAVASVRQHGYRVIVGKLKIPGQPYIILYDVLDARERVLEEELCTDDSVFQYLVSIFFSNLNSTMFREEIQSGKKIPTAIRIFTPTD